MLPVVDGFFTAETEAVTIGRLDVVLCGIGLFVGFVACVDSGRFDVVVVVELWTVVDLCVELCVVVGLGFAWTVVVDVVVVLSVVLCVVLGTAGVVVVRRDAFFVVVTGTYSGVGDVNVVSADFEVWKLFKFWSWNFVRRSRDLNSWENNALDHFLREQRFLDQLSSGFCKYSSIPENECEIHKHEWK